MYDVVNAFLWAKDKSGIYNICNGNSISLNEIIQILGNIANKKPKIRYIDSIEDSDFSYSSKKSRNENFQIRYPIKKGLKIVYNSLKTN